MFSGQLPSERCRVVGGGGGGRVGEGGDGGASVRVAVEPR